MAERGKGLFKAAWDGLVDFAIAHSLAIVSTAAAALMVYLASISKWLTTYGPVAWGSVGIATFLLLAGGSWVVAQGQSIFAHTQFVKRREDSSAINPLDDHFTRRRINLVEFFHPFYKPINAVKFQDCELFGPAAIALMGGTFLGDVFSDCEAVLVKPNARVVGATAFSMCTFERCKFFRVTFLMTKDQYMNMRQQAGGQAMPVISDGTAGDL